MDISNEKKKDISRFLFILCANLSKNIHIGCVVSFVFFHSTTINAQKIQRENILNTLRKIITIIFESEMKCEKCATFAGFYYAPLHRIFVKLIHFCSSNNWMSFQRSTEYTESAPSIKIPITQFFVFFLDWEFIWNPFTSSTRLCW